MLETCEKTEFYVNFSLSQQSKRQYNNNQQEYFSNKLFINNIAYIYYFFLFFRIIVSRYIKMIFHLIFYKVAKLYNICSCFMNIPVFYTISTCSYLFIFYGFLSNCMIIQQWISSFFCDITTINEKVIIYN